MRICFIPRYGREAASSRLRVFALGQALHRLGLAECGMSLERGADVVFVQKADDPTVFRSVERHPCVIYDYDDIWPGRALAAAAVVAKVFTTDTAGHQALAPSGTRCEILPDPIDYEPVAPWPAAEPSDRLAWFGNGPNYESARGMFESASRYARLVAITDRQVSAQCDFMPWSYQEFPERLRDCGTAFLSHRGADQGKSANKLAAAVTFGVPCIVNESPAYEALLNEADLNWAVVRNPAELQAAWDRLRYAEERQRYLAAVQPLVWERYRVDAIARRFMQIAEEVRGC